MGTRIPRNDLGKMIAGDPALFSSAIDPGLVAAINLYNGQIEAMRRIIEIMSHQFLKKNSLSDGNLRSLDRHVQVAVAAIDVLQQYLEEFRVREDIELGTKGEMSRAVERVSAAHERVQRELVRDGSGSQREATDGKK